MSSHFTDSYKPLSANKQMCCSDPVYYYININFKMSVLIKLKKY